MASDLREADSDFYSTLDEIHLSNFERSFELVFSEYRFCRLVSIYIAFIYCYCTFITSGIHVNHPNFHFIYKNSKVPVVFVSL